MPYRLGMPARKLPTAEDAAAARRILLDGLARDDEVSRLVFELASLHPRDNTFPGEVFLDVAADVLDWCGTSRSDPLALEGMQQRFLPECAFRGRQNKKLQFTVLAARLGLDPAADPDALRDQVHDRLRRVPGWLLIFDNADVAADIASWLPSGPLPVSVAISMPPTMRGRRRHVERLARQLGRLSGTVVHLRLAGLHGLQRR